MAERGETQVMDATPDDALRSSLRERVAARALGVSVDVGPMAVRRAFRTTVKSVHPDRSLTDACPDVGRLADARDALIERYERLVVAGLVTPEVESGHDETGAARSEESETEWRRQADVRAARIARERRLGAQVERLMREESRAYRAERDRIRQTAEQARRRADAVAARASSAAPHSGVALPSGTSIEPTGEPSAQSMRQRLDARRDEQLRESAAAEQARHDGLLSDARVRAASKRSSVSRTSPAYDRRVGDRRDTDRRAGGPVGSSVDLAG